MKVKQLYLREGITHIEELPIDQFVDRLRNLHTYDISEKIDGSNIQFGIDSKGFYTSREDKGGSRVYDCADYPLNFATTFQRSAHLALESALPKLRESGFGIGDRVEAEVLFGKLPNAVPYRNDVNRIIFLRRVDGDIDINRLQEALNDVTATVDLPSPFTPDGKDICIANEQHDWRFSKTYTFRISQGNSFTRLVNQFDKFLEGYSGIAHFTNKDVLSIPLNKRPEGIKPKDWADVKSTIKFQREQKIAEGYIHEIKQKMLNKLVRTTSSKFGPRTTEGGWIEGLVFRDPATNEQFKLIDKDVFTLINKFNYDVRYSLNEKARSVDSNTSFMGGIILRLATSMGHAELGTYQAKRYLRKHGANEQEILENLCLDSCDPNLIKDYWAQLLESKYYALEDKLEEYNNSRHLRELIVEFAEEKRTFTYNDEIHQRTLQEFAVTFKRINSLLEGIDSSHDLHDLVRLLVGRQLNSL